MKKTTRLHNVMFPFWMFYLLPTYFWLIILPANFVVDSLVLVLAAKVHKLQNKLELWKKSILKIWLIGFFSDMIGAALTLGILFILGILQLDSWIDTRYGMAFLSLPGVILAGVLIYFLNKKLSFKKCDFDAYSIKKLSIALAIFTAPYTMLIPAYF